MNIGIAEKLASALQTLLANEYSNVAHSNDELHDASDALDEFHREALAEYDTAKGAEPPSPAMEQCPLVASGRFKECPMLCVHGYEDCK